MESAGVRDPKRRYFKKLKEQRETVSQLRSFATKESVTLVFAAKNEKFNNAVVLKIEEVSSTLKFHGSVSSKYINSVRWMKRSLLSLTMKKRPPR